MHVAHQLHSTEALVATSFADDVRLRAIADASVLQGNETAQKAFGRESGPRGPFTIRGRTASAGWLSAVAVLLT